MAKDAVSTTGIIKSGEKRKKELAALRKQLAALKKKASPRNQLDISILQKKIDKLEGKSSRPDLEANVKKEAKAKAEREAKLKADETKANKKEAAKLRKAARDILQGTTPEVKKANLDYSKREKLAIDLFKKADKLTGESIAAQELRKAAASMAPKNALEQSNQASAKERARLLQKEQPAKSGGPKAGPGNKPLGSGGLLARANAMLKPPTGPGGVPLARQRHVTPNSALDKFLKKHNIDDAGFAGESGDPNDFPVMARGLDKATGARPNRIRTFNQMALKYWELNPQQLAVLKRRLFNGGFFGDMDESEIDFEAHDQLGEEAWGEALRRAGQFLAAGKNITVDDVIDQGKRMPGAGADGEKVAPFVAETTDPAAVRETVRSVATSILGQDPDPGLLEKLVREYNAMEVSRQRSAYDLGNAETGGTLVRPMDLETFAHTRLKEVEPQKHMERAYMDRFEDFKALLNAPVRLTQNA